MCVLLKSIGSEKSGVLWSNWALQVHSVICGVDYSSCCSYVVVGYILCLYSLSFVVNCSYLCITPAIYYPLNFRSWLPQLLELHFIFYSHSIVRVDYCDCWGYTSVFTDTGLLELTFAAKLRFPFYTQPIVAFDYCSRRSCTSLYAHPTIRVDCCSCLSYATVSTLATVEVDCSRCWSYTSFITSSQLSVITHFMPLISFDTPWKHQKTSGFLMFSGGIKRDP